MYVKINRAIKVFLLAIFFSNSVYANNDFTWDNFEISGAGGWNWINTENTDLDISSLETDSIRVSDTDVGGAWKFGVGYYVVKHLLVELNVYGGSNTVEGDVWQFEMPDFNNYTFKAPISSTRLMLDFKPNIITWKKLTPYLILGVGATWNEASYEEEANPGINPNSALSLSENTGTQLAWNVGAGLSYGLTDRLSVTAEYVYAFLGEATPDDNASIADAPNFSYQIQSLLFGFSLRM